MFRVLARHKPVPQKAADEICFWISQGLYLLDYCRLPGKPSPRTVYYWAEKDPMFRRRFIQARAAGEGEIRAQYAEVLLTPKAVSALRGTRRARRAFRRRYLRPIDLRLQRWLRHPRRRPQQLAEGTSE